MIRSTPRTALKNHRCEPCGGVIQPGDRYLENVASPHHGELGNEVWWRLAECATCAERCGRGVA